ncbi:hypothetical protein QFC20_004316 [Naganishia adeliensis]|uniref:Uncharacterized protein n=1 Tax=Naganishia adeliensis TaxID=92952 RepID=A0ACC2W2M8_9TREE|nr:hypothetical protein QFC20_004316 [Naganishia adeliensis]
MSAPKAHTSETTKQVNVPKASDDSATKQEKDNSDPAEAHGEDTGGKPHATEVDGPGAKADKVVDL